MKNPLALTPITPRNGYKSKRVNSSYGNFSVEVPQDRNSTFEPQIVPKLKRYFDD